MLRHVVIVFVALATLSSVALAERRVALVVGNDGYRQIDRLLKARGDADAMAATLKTMGFETTLAHDLDNLGFGQVLDRFVASLQPTDTALFFFAGHGVEVDGTNYLLPTDMPNIDPGQTQFQRSAYKVREIVDRIRQRSVRVAIAVIDACRDNPLRAAGQRGSATRGLGRMEAEAGEFLLFSAGPQQAALDRLSDSDASQTSVFTRVFVKHLPTPGASLVEIAKRTQSEVVELARTAQRPHAQFPAYDDRILGNFTLVPQLQPAAASTVPASSLPSAAQAEFELARAIGTAAAWDAFLARNPTGFLADTARRERQGVASHVAAQPPQLAALQRPEISDDQASPSEAAIRSINFWSYNGSSLWQETIGSKRKLFYMKPRDAVLKGGVKPGTQFFDGDIVEGRYEGHAFAFFVNCSPRKYRVSGQLSEGGQVLTLRGKSPVLTEKGCIVRRQEEKSITIRSAPDLAKQFTPAMASR